MASQDERKYDEKLLTRYLLGSLSREETERLDELSVVDDDFAALLNVAENDLVDAYVRKELTPGDSEKFAAAYLSSPRRREKVEFAHALVSLKRHVSSVHENQPAPSPEAASAPAAVPFRKRSGWGWMQRLAFAGVTLTLILAAGYLLRKNLGLQRQMTAAQVKETTLLQRQQQLEHDLEQEHSANTEIGKQLEQGRTAAPQLDQLKTVAMLLPPPTRGTARIPSLAVRTGTDLAVLMLTLEADDFPAYRAALKDPETNKVLWQSESLAAYAAGDKKVVCISFAASLLKQQNYLIELSGVPARGSPEVVASYPLHAVLK